MTPFAIAHRVAHLANCAASGDPAARAELVQALGAAELFNEEIREVFVGALEPGTYRFLIDAHGVEITNMSPRLADLLIERGAA